MPYRIDLARPSADTFDRLVDLGALDVDDTDIGIAAILPDSVTVDDIARALARDDVRVTAAPGRDDESIWRLRPRPVRVGRFLFLPADSKPSPDALRLTDSPAFGTGLHPTSALCLEALEDEVSAWRPSSILDVGAGSGLLALAALQAGVPRAVAIDIDDEAVRATVVNARLNGLESRLQVIHCGPDALTGAWPLVVANIVAAPLMEMAPVLAQRLSHSGRLVLSGIRASLAAEVGDCYVRRGMSLSRAQSRNGWTTLTLAASW